MKRQTLIFVILTVATSLFAQFEICQSNTSKHLNDVYFIDENIGVAVGDSGIIIRSSDGGNTWISIMQNDSINFHKVKFWDINTGIAAGNQIYTTSDGGLIWKHQELLGEKYFSDIELFEDHKFLVSAINSESIIDPEPNQVIKYQLFDDHVTILFEKFIDYDITQMSFINDSTGFAHHFDGSMVSSVLRTDDGGKNWNRLDFESGTDFTLIEDLVFLSEEIGFMGGWYNSHLMKTTDGGSNWQTVNIKNTESTIFDLPAVFDFSIDANHSNNFYSCGWYGEIFKSIDSGDNWEEIETPLATNISLKSIFFLDELKGWAVGEKGTIIKTTNGGLSTSIEERPTEIINIYPNPFDNIIKMDIPDNEFEKIKLYSLLGNLLETSEQNYFDNLDYLSAGVYILVVEYLNAFRTFKIIKE